MSFVCPSCRRRFVVVKSTRPEDARCVCGTALAAAELQAGVYEIKRSRRATRRRPHRAASKGASVPVEPDLGYGESHGYGPAHGGPTGPGDAPAPETAAPTSEKTV